MSVSPSMRITIACYCGLHSYPLTLLSASSPYPVELCHCSSCRHLSGGPCTAYLPCSSPLSDAIANLTEYRTSEGESRWFCSKCGTHMYETRKTEPDPGWAVSVGVLETHEGVEFVLGEHTHVGDTRDGGIADLLPQSGGKVLPRWAGEPEKSAELPLGWRSALSSETDDAKLWAECHCAGVKFYITRPTSQSQMAARPGWPEFLGPYRHSTTFDPAREMWWLHPLGQEHRTKYAAEICTCNDCRRALGFWFTVWAYVPLCNLFDASGSPLDLHAELGTLRHVESPSIPGATRSFCSRCGANVFWWKEGKDLLIDVAVGILKAEEGARAEEWLVWETRVIICKTLAKEKRLTEELLEGMKAFQTRSEK